MIAITNLFILYFHTYQSSNGAAISKFVDSLDQVPLKNVPGELS